ncbi:ATP-binding cassette domain-containing protein [Xanthomonas sp. NCPPB 2632]|uniref:ATP-binding cassette domain-containing protein n=1 Tax=Xanthomonas sp. NCPPB 2632 TaxID=3240912 RepID=UPI003515F468
MLLTQSLRLLRTLLRQTFSRSQVRWLVASTVLSIAVVLVQTLGPLALRSTLNAASSASYTKALTGVAIFAVSLGVSRIFRNMSALWFQRYSERCRTRISELVYDHLLHVSHEYHAQRDIGGLMSHVNEGIAGALAAQSTIFFGLLPLLLNVVAVGGVLLTFHQPGILVIMGVFCIAYTFIFRRGLMAQGAVQATAIHSDAAAAGALTDALVNHETIRMFGAQRSTAQRISDALGLREKGWIAFHQVRANHAHVLNVLYTGCFLAIMILLAGQIAGGAMKAGDFIMLMLYATQLFAPLEAVGATMQDIAHALVNISRLAPIIDEPREGTGGETHLAEDDGFQLSIRNLSFSYREDRPILQNIDVHVPSGGTLAIVGASGSGKTTLSRLIFGLYAPASGSIDVNGMSVAGFDRASFRSAIAIVPQDTALFNDTLRFNIAIARPGATDAELAAAARLAGLDPLLAALPQGWDALVGERGLRLSGGERQRVAIARAILKRPKCFIFDEATASLDTRTERLIQANIDSASKGVTTIIIAHRLSTIVAADHIVVMDAGTVAEQGSHEDLLARSGIYADMWRAQNAPRSVKSESEYATSLDG